MSQFFEKAIPVWQKGKACEKNHSLLFRVIAGKSDNTVLRLTGSSLYQIFVNGEFVAAGPARAAHGYYRVDEIDVTQNLKLEDNVIVIQVAGYYINTFYTLEQPAFLCAELLVENLCVAATGINGFEARSMVERVQKVHRYSYQRPFVEVYEWTEELEEFKTNPHFYCQTVDLETQPSKEYMSRGMYYPRYEVEVASEVVECGTVQISKEKVREYTDRSYIRIDDSLHGYAVEELTVSPVEDLCRQVYVEGEKKEDIGELLLQNGTYSMLSLGKNLSGAVEFQVDCQTETTLYMTFDELIIENDYKFRLFDHANIVMWKLKPGSYHLLTFEPYVMKYVRFASIGGDCCIRDVRMRRYGYPEIKKTLQSNHEKLQRIYEAAVETFRQNTYDILMDCPSRERAGWLCDSFFTGRTEYALTGKNQVEHNFLENYALCSNGTIPEGMLPMCYPADFENTPEYIPQWAMWFVIELEDYYRRTGDRELVLLSKQRVDKLLAYFKDYENEYGMLERLDGINMIEQSETRRYMKDVNFPTNMLYMLMKQCVGDLYEDSQARQQADELRKTIFRMSFRNGFFVDNAIRTMDGKLELTNNISECCQYFAFFTGIANLDNCKDLWDILVKDFGYERRNNGKWKQVAFANAFIGNYLRMELLCRYGEKEKMLHDIEQYFFYMAERTGTLWEYEDTHASCNHGFASYVAYLFDKLELLVESQN